MADKQTYKDLWGLCYFYTGSLVGRQAYLWDYAIFTLVFNWQTSILVRLCHFHTGASVGRQAYMWDYAIFTLVLQLADKHTCEDTATSTLIVQVADKHTCETVSTVILHWFFNWQTSVLVRLHHFTLVLQLADKHTCETVSFYTGSSSGRQAYLWDYTKAVFSSTACLQLVEQCIMCEDLWALYQLVEQCIMCEDLWALYHGGCCMNQDLK